MDNLTLSTLGHTWIIDIDGTIVKHNGYKTDGEDTFLPGAEEFLKMIPKQDMIIFLTSRAEEYREMTESFLTSMGIRYDTIIFGVPYGERIIINDNKPGGLKTALAVNLPRNGGVPMKPQYDTTL